MPATSRPVAASERIAVSRPDPGPFTNTSTFCSPCSCALRAADSAASCAANGVDLREPLNPTLPAEAHEIVLPCRSVIVTIVLLNVDLMCACPWTTFFFSRRLVFLAFGFAILVSPLLLRGFLLACHGLAGALAGPRVGVGPLSSHRQAAAVPNALVRADLDLALDVLGGLAPEVTLDLVGAVDELPDPADLVLGQVSDLGAALHPGSLNDLERACGPDPVDVPEGDVHALVARKVDACDPGHALAPCSSAIPDAACAAGWCRSHGSRHAGG